MSAVASPVLSVDSLLEAAVSMHASDLHLSAGVPPTVRVWGALKRMELPALSAEDVERLVSQVVDDKGRETLERNLQLDTSYVCSAGRFRVNIFRQRGVLAAAFRFIPSRVPGFSELGLPPVIHSVCELQRGLVLVTGTAGQGKSTTLASIVDRLNRERKLHIVTVEDPIEYAHEHVGGLVHQREIGHDARSFPEALRAALREDPDVIMVGEMRDLETISIALTAAETGHLVLATLHTAGAAETVDRIVDVFPPEQQQQVRVQLASVIECVVWQQLVPRARVESEGGALAGRVLAAEVMLGTYAVRSLIRDGKTHQLRHVMETGIALGMQTMERSLASLVMAGQITREEAFRRCRFPDELARLLGTKPEAGL
jgi:twitching motility protein PilT